MFCPECRTELSEDTKYCIKCGYDFTKIKTPPERKHTSDSPDTLDGSSTIYQPEIEADSFKVGSLFADRYEILSEGRKGGMGTVYKCKDTKLEEIVALKVIHPKLLSSTQAVSRFRQEVALSRKLQHPNIVRVYNLEEWQDKEYFTMEWVEGVTLREILNKRKKQNKPFTLIEAGNIISQLTTTLHYAHKYTVHRDIKPENILVETDEDKDKVQKDLTNIKIRLTDFGIAKMLSPGVFTTASIQMGTPYYMAPEQKTDAATVDKRADIYALGVVLFELLTLENTIGLELPSEINRELPKEINNVTKKAVATKPDMRYGDINDLLADLDKIIVEDKRRIEEEKNEEEKLKRREAEEKKQEQERSRREAEEHKLRVREEEEEPEEDMCCPKCGKEQEEGAKFCTSCGVEMALYQGVGQTGLHGWETRCFPCTTEKFHGLLADLKDWLISQNFNCQQITGEDRGTIDKYTVLQVAKKGGWRKFAGMSTALNIVLYQKPNHIIVEIGAGRWIDKALVGAAAFPLLFWFPPLAFAAGFGTWQQIKLPKKIYQYISEKCN